jgi:hypothetical protein
MQFSYPSDEKFVDEFAHVGSEIAESPAKALAIF